MLQYGAGGGNYFKTNLLGRKAVYDVLFVEEITTLVERGVTGKCMISASWAGGKLVWSCIRLPPHSILYLF